MLCFRVAGYLSFADARERGERRHSETEETRKLEKPGKSETGEIRKLGKLGNRTQGIPLDAKPGKEKTPPGCIHRPTIVFAGDVARSDFGWTIPPVVPSPSKREVTVRDVPRTRADLH